MLTTRLNNHPNTSIKTHNPYFIYGIFLLKQILHMANPNIILDHPHNKGRAYATSWTYNPAYKEYIRPPNPKRFTETYESVRTLDPNYPAAGVSSNFGTR